MTLDSVQCQVGVMFTQEIKHAVYSEDEACCIFFFCHENNILEIDYLLVDCLRKLINK